MQAVPTSSIDKVGFKLNDTSRVLYITGDALNYLELLPLCGILIKVQRTRPSGSMPRFEQISRPPLREGTVPRAHQSLSGWCHGIAIEIPNAALRRMKAASTFTLRQGCHPSYPLAFRSCIIVLPLRFSSRAADLCGVSIWKDSQFIARGSKAGDTSRGISPPMGNDLHLYRRDFGNRTKGKTLAIQPQNTEKARDCRTSGDSSARARWASRCRNRAQL